MLQKNSRYLDIEEYMGFTDPISSETKMTLWLRAPTLYKQNDGSRIHVVNVGDDLFTISKTYYGDPTLWWIIADNNIDRCLNPFEMNVGDELFIPKISF